MTSSELRQKFLDFFARKSHAVIPSASLLPENDPTVLFTTAGMHPLVPYLLGEKHASGTRLASCQKCVRTDDIEEVGDATHLTFFEMLGNWSLGDYFKREAIQFSWEFLTTELKLPKEKLAVSVFAGDADAPFDEEAFMIWRDEIGIAETRIAKLPKKNNWWGPAGVTGPCGPDTEIFFWTGEGDAPASFADDHVKWVEIWNDVFMQFNKTADGRFEPLAQKNVDTGLGLERVATILQGKPTVYETDLFAPIIDEIRELSGCHPEPVEGGSASSPRQSSSSSQQDSSSPQQTSERIIADHIRAAVFIVGDARGVPPSNVGAGYVVRKLLRRAIRHSRKIGIETAGFTATLAEVVIREYSAAYPELEKNREKIVNALREEEEKFSRTLERGEREIAEFIEKGNAIDGKQAFYFYETYGFPRELTEEFLRERGLKLEKPEEFERAFAEHQTLSRTASAGVFKGGLADHSEETTALHTAAHLLQAALRQVLGAHVLQRGSNITAERLRFDFSHGEKMTPEQLAEVERLVNEAIQQDLPVSCEELTVEEAKAAGALGVFESKYGERVKVYSAGDFSKEICGGPHVARTSELGKFKIQKEEASSAGVRRIKAALLK